MPDLLTQNDLRPGDVLLHHSWHWVSTLIRAFDGGEFSHASIYDGARVVEMDTPGIVTRTVDQIRANTAYVHVFRFSSKDGHQLGSEYCPYEPVIERIGFYMNLKPRLAWGTFPILGGLTLVRRVARDRSDLCRTLDRIGAPISRFVATRHNAITCTEFVYRCFAEAGELYDLSITGRSSSVWNGIAAHTVVQGFTRASKEDNSRLDREPGRRTRFDKMSAWIPGAEPTFVTAADLSHSPNLLRIGELSRTRP
jgi:hypothetical protein